MTSNFDEFLLTVKRYALDSAEASQSSIFSSLLIFRQVAEAS